MTKQASNNQPTSHEKAWPFALLSCVTGGCSIGLLILILRHADKIVALGLTSKFFFVVYAILGLCASACLFGISRSTAIYRGKAFGGRLELGGPAALFFLIVLLGNTLPESSDNFSLTIIVHGPKGHADMVLRSSGSIVLDTGGVRRLAQIGPNGEAVFSEIPANLRGTNASVGLDAEGFEPAEPLNELTLSPSTFYVEVRHMPDRVVGYVKTDQGEPIPGATVSVEKIRTTTDDRGYFEMQITGEDASRDVSIVATKPGYEPWTGLEVINSNEIIITLQKKM